MLKFIYFHCDFVFYCITIPLIILYIGYGYVDCHPCLSYYKQCCHEHFCTCLPVKMCMSFSGIYRNCGIVRYDILNVALFFSLFVMSTSFDDYIGFIVELQNGDTLFLSFLFQLLSGTLLWRETYPLSFWLPSGTIYLGKERVNSSLFFLSSSVFRIRSWCPSILQSLPVAHIVSSSANGNLFNGYLSFLFVYSFCFLCNPSNFW